MKNSLSVLGFGKLKARILFCAVLLLGLTCAVFAKSYDWNTAFDWILESPTKTYTQSEAAIAIENYAQNPDAALTKVSSLTKDEDAMVQDFLKGFESRESNHSPNNVYINMCSGGSDSNYIWGYYIFVYNGDTEHKFWRLYSTPKHHK
ncbi:MAG: hypothetical protein LBM77_02605 [Spirochaetaceae bacterium]|jgi:hypothetical protein|nr:hypothetical protein [Spirochaetaceae bacterium]